MTATGKTVIAAFTAKNADNPPRLITECITGFNSRAVPLVKWNPVSKASKHDIKSTAIAMNQLRAS